MELWHSQKSSFPKSLVLSKEVLCPYALLSSLSQKVIVSDLVFPQVAVCMNNSQPYVEQNSSYVYPDYAQWAAGTRSVNLLAPTAVSKDIRLYFGSTTPAAAVSTATSTAVVTSITSSAGVGSSTSSSAKASSTSSKPSAGERVKVGSIGSLVLLALTAFLV